MNIANGVEITLIKSTSVVLHWKIKVGDFIAKVDGTPVEKPNDLFLIRGPSHFRTFLDGFIKIAVPHTPPSDIATIDSISIISENDVLCGRGKQSDLGNCQLRAIVQDFQPTYPSDYYHAHNHDSDFKARLAKSRFKCELKVYEIHSHYCYV